MAKRARSAKQKANDKRLGRMTKARGRKSSRSTSSSRRRTAKRVIKSVRRRTSMAKRKVARRRSGIFGGSKIKSIGKAVAIGAGTGVALNLVGSAVGQPSLASNPIIGAIGAFFLGGPIAGGVALLAGGGLQGILGGGSNQQSMDGLA